MGDVIQLHRKTVKKTHTEIQYQFGPHMRLTTAFDHLRQTWAAVLETRTASHFVRDLADETAVIEHTYNKAMELVA